MKFSPGDRVRFVILPRSRDITFLTGSTQINTVDEYVILPESIEANPGRALIQAPSGAKLIAPEASLLLARPADIAIDDPRLQWIWDRAAKLAEKRGVCGEYDKFIEDLGIPPRERTFGVDVIVGGTAISVPVKARSIAEARSKAREALGGLAL